MILYTFAKALFEILKVILLLPPVLTILQIIFLVLSIICKTLLLIVKRSISLYNTAISTKTTKTSFISQTNNVEKANINLRANVITNLAIYLWFFLKYLFNVKDVLYVAKKIVGLQIIYSKSLIMPKNVLVTSF